MENVASMLNTGRSLIDAHQRGDPEAFPQLLRRYGSVVLGYLIKMSGNREQAEDFFQETFKRVHEKAHTFRGSRFESWLFRIATNVALDGLRRQKRLPVVSLGQKFDCNDGNCGGLSGVAVADNQGNPSREAIKAEQAEKVRQAVWMLPARQRATLALAYYQQLSYREVAEVLGCSVGTVKTQMYRALKTLARKLPDFGGEIK